MFIFACKKDGKHRLVECGHPENNCMHTKFVGSVMISKPTTVHVLYMKMYNFVQIITDQLCLPERTWLLHGRIQPDPTQPGCLCITDGTASVPCLVNFSFVAC